jgi:acetyltransferase
VAEYPAQLARQHRLADGRMVTIRPIRPDDAARVRDFLSGSSGETRYRRFLKWVGAPTENLVHFMTDVDYERHLALVCTVARADGEDVVGEARYVTNPDGRSCEFAIMIQDSWQKTGIAGLLMDALMRAARERGIARMEGLVLSANSSMLRFARALGFEAATLAEDPSTVRITKTLEPVS